MTPINPKVFGSSSPYRVKKTVEYGISPPSNASSKFRKEVRDDRAWCFEIPCRRGKFENGRKGHIFSHGVGVLGFSGCGTRLRTKLLNVPGVKKRQTGDEEFSVIFPIESLGAVAEVVLPYLSRRKKTSETAPSELISAQI